MTARQKWLIMPIQTFSLGLKGKEKLCFDDLPWAVRLYLKFFKKKVFVIHDEISWIKTNTPMNEEDKSTRSRAIKLLEQHSESRCGLTGTLLTKSPCNIIDPYRFLSATFFENESMWDIASRHSIMMTLRTARGRRVQISQKEWDRARTRMINAFRFGGDMQLESCKDRLFRELGLKDEDCEHILRHKTYTPFKNIDKLLRRVENVTFTVNREDIFDISMDEKVYDPIMRGVRMGEEGLRLGKEFIKVGFTDNYELGKSASLELMHRLKDLCNGFEPMQNVEEYEVGEPDEDGTREAKPKITFRPLKENPKLDLLEELLSEIDVEQNQTVVWVSRRNAFASVHERLCTLDISHALFSGDQSKEDKQEAEKRMLSGEARVFVGNPAAAAFGLNFLARCNYMIWYCIDGSVERYHQAQHRILRGQSKTPKFAYMLYIKGSVEERNLRSVNSGVELLSASNAKSVFEFSGY